MVAKISTGASLYGALAYNQNKVDEGHAKVLAANLILQPEDGNFHLQDCMEDFKNWYAIPLPYGEARYPYLPQSAPG